MSGYPVKTPKKGLPRPYAIDCSGASPVRQCFTKECDVNEIVERFTKTGVIDHVNSASPLFADVSDLPTFQEVRERVARGRSIFEGLPEEERRKFDFKYEKFAAFASDPRNGKEVLAMFDVEVVGDEDSEGTQSVRDVPSSKGRSDAPPGGEGDRGKKAAEPSGGAADDKGSGPSKTAESGSDES